MRSVHPIVQPTVATTASTCPMTRAGDSDDRGDRAIATSACWLRSPPAASVSASATLTAIAEPTDASDASFFSSTLLSRWLRHWCRGKLEGSGIGNRYCIWAKQREAELKYHDKPRKNIGMSTGQRLSRCRCVERKWLAGQSLF